jgi:hypothetical protein
MPERYSVGPYSWRRLGTAEIRRLLQSVAHGTTGYSVIFRANDMSIDVAVDDLACRSAMPEPAVTAWPSRSTIFSGLTSM